MSNFSSKDIQFMQRALLLAEKGKGWTNPNPMVGAVLVKNEKCIGEGYHQNYRGDHAEIEAIKTCTTSPEGATLYVSLEPCCHFGNTGPCTKALIKHGIQKVVIASQDPSEKINGKGIEQLKKAGIQVQCGLLEKENEQLNRAFFTFHRKKRPFVTLKLASSLDGKVGKKGQKIQITGKTAQDFVHQLRHEHQGILIGAGTLLNDNPHLGVRNHKGRDPLRIILQGKRKLPQNATVFRDQNTMILQGKNIKEVLKELHENNIISILVEGGPKIAQSFLAAQAVDEFHLLRAPNFLGKNHISLETLDAYSFETTNMQKLGQDFCITLQPQWDSNNGSSI